MFVDVVAYLLLGPIVAALVVGLGLGWANRSRVSPVLVRKDRKLTD